MYKNTTKDPLVAVVTAAMGAGLAASISVSHGQNVFVGIGITVFATAIALVVDKFCFK